MSKFDSFFDAATAAPTKTAKGKSPTKTRAAQKRLAKRDDPDYKQALAYIRADTHKRIKVALAEDGDEFSELIEKLLNEWLQKRGNK